MLWGTFIFQHGLGPLVGKGHCKSCKVVLIDDLYPMMNHFYPVGRTHLTEWFDVYKNHVNDMLYVTRFQPNGKSMGDFGLMC